VSFFSPIFAGADHKSSQKVFRNSGRARAGIIWDNVCPIIDSSWSFASHTGGSQGGGAPLPVICNDQYEYICHFEATCEIRDGNVLK